MVLDGLNLYIVTFNCGRTLINPTAFGTHLFDAARISSATPGPDPTNWNQQPDILVLNLQEIAPTAQSFLGGSLLAPYYGKFREAVKQATELRYGVKADDDSSFVNLETQNVGMTAIMVFVRADIAKHVTNPMTAGVGVGVHEMGNKGAVGVRISWKHGSDDDGGSGGDSSSDQEGNDDDLVNGDTALTAANGRQTSQWTSLVFVSAHLAPMEEDTERRNQDYKDIAAGLVFTPSQLSATTTSGGGAEDVPLLSATPHSPNTTASRFSLPTNLGLYSSPQHVFFAGDLNYRTSNSKPSPQDVQNSFPQPCPPDRPKHWSHLLEHDQLTTNKREGKTLHGLHEAPVTFPPTYKYKNEMSKKDALLDSELDDSGWNWATHRWPSWCDRILSSLPLTSQSSSGSSLLSSSSAAATPLAASTSTKSLQVIVHEYTALPLFKTSDHRPVAMSCTLPLSPPRSQTTRSTSKPEDSADAAATSIDAEAGNTITTTDFSTAKPIPIRPDWQKARAAARRREIVVGVLSYAGTTREGNAIAVGGILGLLALWFLGRALSL